jgi:hypothetical protein|nr:MAG TPA: hypothetical protein [Caudoviricetes sp.]
MNYDELITKLDQLLPPKNHKLKVSEKYFYYCYGYLTALDSFNIISKEEYLKAHMYVTQAMSHNKYKEE